MKIYDIDFSCPHDEFIDGLRNHLNNYGNANMNANSIELSTRNGKYMYKIEVTCSDDPNVTTMVFEKNANNGDIMFAVTGLRSFNGTFYSISSLSDSVKNTSDDTSIAFMDYLESMAKTKKGKLVYKAEKQIVCIVNGNNKQVKECIIDNNGNVYGSKEVSNVSLFDGSDTMVSYNTKLPEWNKQRRQEDPDFASILTDKTTTVIEKYNLIGKYLMMLRLKDEITSDEFKDLFVQAGVADSYVNDKTLNTVFKLLKN